MTAEQILALLALIADMRIQLAQQATRIVELEAKITAADRSGWEAERQ